MKIDYIDSNCKNSGYGRASLGYIRKLIELGHDVHVGPSNRKPDVKIIHEVPAHIDKALLDSTVSIIFFYAWELPTLPQSFIDVLNKCTHCCTFSEFQVEVYKKSTGKDNITYLPHIPPEISYSTLKKEKNKDIFIFLSVSRWDERKDPRTLIRSFFNEFNAEEPVKLILKIQDANIAYINKVIEHCRPKGKTSPSIEVIADYLDYEGIKNLYTKADVFVSATRAEGWGLCFNEALLYGVPCIYPDSPYIVRKFFDTNNSIKVLCRDIPVSPFWLGSFFFRNQTKSHIVWSQVDETQLKKAMRKVFNDYDNLFTLPIKPSAVYLEEQQKIGAILQGILKKV